MLSRVLSIFLIIILLVAGLFWKTYSDFLETPLDIPEQGLVYEVKPGTTMRQIAQDLKLLGLLEHPILLRLYTRLENNARDIKAGEYQLSADLMPTSLLALFISGKTLSYKLTLVEGWTFKEVRAAIASHPMLTQTIVNLSDADIMQKLGSTESHAEGWFFPDTYLFPRGTTDLQFLARAHQRMSSVLEEAWMNRSDGLPLENPYQALILASIIEKETGSHGERAEIAGVFTKRLHKGMKLQTDPTVIYGMGETYKGNIRRKDLIEDTPYNTYVHTGLTPTPICMPGKAAIEAAVHPADNNSLYFVARGDGSHQFSATLQQHNAAVRKYQLKK